MILIEGVAVVVVLGVSLPVVFGAGAQQSTDPRLSATVVGGPGNVVHLAVSWDGREGALLDVWLDLDLDGVPSSHELVEEGRTLKPGIEVIDIEHPPGGNGKPDPTVWVRARDHGWCATDAETATRGRCSWQPGFGAEGVLDSRPDAMIVHDEGSGPALFLAGLFETADGVTVNHIARWDGATWSALGTGLEGPSFVYAEALATFDDGSGPALYVGGDFATAGGIEANGIAR